MTDDQRRPFEGKTCFIILPVGPVDSGVRRTANGLIDVVFRPTLESMGFEATAAHESESPGSITRQIILNLLNCDLVVADLTHLNPNVMYELAVRHCKRLPVVTLAEEGTQLPFDVAAERTIFYQNEIAGVGDLSRRLSRAVEAAMQETALDNPVYRAAEAEVMESVTPAESTNSYILRRLESIEATLNDVYRHDKVMVQGKVSRIDESGAVFVEVGGKEFELAGQQYEIILSCTREIKADEFMHTLSQVPAVRVIQHPGPDRGTNFDCVVTTAFIPGTSPAERAAELEDMLRRNTISAPDWEWRVRPNGPALSSGEEGISAALKDEAHDAT